jgi:chondroitin 4-sulfotransferase 11
VCNPASPWEALFLKPLHTISEFVFIHINKTGGSSVERALGLALEHKTAVEKRCELGPAWEAKFSFTIVRNPWDKVVSHYHYRVQKNQTGLAAEPVPFDDWVQLCFVDRDPRYYDKPKMFMPQFDWISDSEGRLLVDFVGRFESIQNDFEQICRRLGRRATLPHLKKTERRDYRTYYSDASRTIVAQWFAKDIDLFGYRF